MISWLRKRASSTPTHTPTATPKSLFIPEEGERVVVRGPGFEPREGVVTKLQIGVSGHSTPNRRGGMDYAESTFGWFQVRMDDSDRDSDFLPSGAALPWTAIMHDGGGARNVSVEPAKQAGAS